MITVSEPRKVREHVMFTMSGLPVFSFGRKHTLEAASHRLPAFTTESIESNCNRARLIRAAAELGQPVEWRFNRLASVMDVSF